VQQGDARVEALFEARQGLRAEVDLGISTSACLPASRVSRISCK
jgi:hypothetical protein